MAKLKEFVKSHDSLCVFLLFLVISTGFIFKNEILGYDSLWVFGNLYKLGHGFQIYEEVNIITFPLFYEVFQVLLSLFNNYLGFLLLNYLIVTPLYFMIYQIFKACNVKRRFALLFTLIIWIIYNQVVLVGPSYNTLALLFYITGLLLYFKKKDSKFSFIIQGVLAFLTLMCNQKFGAAYVIGLLLLHLFDSESKKKAIVSLLKTYLITALLCALFVVILFLTNKLNSFVDLTLSGLGSFTQNFTLRPNSIMFLIGILIFSVFGFICIKKMFNNYKNIKTLLCFTIPLLLVTYPIFNDYHFYIYLTAFGIPALYIFYNLFEQLLDHKFVNKIISIITILTVLGLIIFSVVIFINWNSKKNNNPNDAFYGAVIADYLESPIEETNKYIESLNEQNKNYRILSIHAMFYTLRDVPEKNNGYFDMPLRGNFGKEDWHKLIAVLDQEPEGTYIIIDAKINGDFSVFQFPGEVYDYINEHYKYVQDLGEYVVYEK